MPRLRVRTPASTYVLFVAIRLFAISPLAVAQEDPALPAMAASTATDATIPVDHLKVLLRPQTQDDLERELAAWLELLKAKITEVGKTELQLKALDGEVKEKAAPEVDAPPEKVNEELDTLKEQLGNLKTEETAIVERVRTVIEALKVKGGDVETAEQFVSAVSDITETTDATSFQAAIVAEVTNWVGRDDGGKLWARRSIMAVIVLLVFWVISKFAGRVTAKALSRHSRASALLENFARRTTGGVVFVIGILMALSVLGVQIGPLMAALGAGGFIVGFALQETLGSFASGLMIMVYRPFDVDDYISVAGVDGTVKEMSLVSTTLLTIDNKVLVIPNKKAWSDTIINYTGKDIRRVDLVFGIGYGDDIQHATDVLKQVAGEHQLVLDEPALTVHVDELADSSVNLFCRPWVKTADYWTVHWDLTRQVKERFDAEGISFPFPQRDVHLQAENESA